MTDAVERTSLLISDRFKSPIRMSFEPDLLKVSCTTALGSVHDEIPCSSSGETLEIGFNYRYILDALRNGGAATVRLRLNEMTMPLVIMPEEGEDFLYLILPVRLRGNE